MIGRGRGRHHGRTSMLDAGRDRQPARRLSRRYVHHVHTLLRSDSQQTPRPSNAFLPPPLTSLHTNLRAVPPTPPAIPIPCSAPSSPLVGSPSRPPLLTSPQFPKSSLRQRACSQSGSSSSASSPSSTPSRTSSPSSLPAASIMQSLPHSQVQLAQCLSPFCARQFNSRASTSSHRTPGPYIRRVDPDVCRRARLRRIPHSKQSVRRSVFHSLSR